MGLFNKNKDNEKNTDNWGDLSKNITRIFSIFVPTFLPNDTSCSYSQKIYLENN